MCLTFLFRIEYNIDKMRDRDNINQEAETMTIVFINKENNLRVSIKGENFAILGNEELVNDDEILSMYKGIVPAGWQTEADYIRGII